MSRLDRHDCYELCVQNAARLVPMLAGVHGGRGDLEPTMLHEHFSGSAALSRRWVAAGRERGHDRRVIAIDLDAEVLAVGERKAREEGVSDGVRFECIDVFTRNAAVNRADIVFVGNFSIGYIHHRAALVEYLQSCRAELNTQGVFVCDTYAGQSAFREGGVTRVVPVTDRLGTRVRYTWEQREADALTAMVTSVLHFQIEQDGEMIDRFADAFVYRWRLWGIAELREAMREAGFADTRVYQSVSTAPTPMTHGRELNEAGIVCVVARM